MGRVLSAGTHSMGFISSTAAIAEYEKEDRSSQDREFAFSDTDFRLLAKFAHDNAGIFLPDSKRNLVYGRLSRRLRALGLNGFREYREYLSSDSSEVQRFINAISTNLTKFFRESHHFKHFDQSIAASLAQDGSKKLRVWSAGCSTGEEPYTIAAVVNRRASYYRNADIRILATDIDTDVLATARRGEYPSSSTDDVPQVFRAMFTEKHARNADKVIIAGNHRDLIRFRQLNLIETWPFKGCFDAIFCRNVMIYFDAPTKARLVDRFAERLRPGGWLYIGHSESLTRSHPLLELEGKTIYRRRA